MLAEPFDEFTTLNALDLQRLKREARISTISFIHERANGE
jgi:hypothetical protein